MIHHRTTKEARRFDIFKLFVIIVLVLLLLALLICRPFQPSTTSVPPTDVQPVTEVASGDEATAEAEATAKAKTTADAEAAAATTTAEAEAAADATVTAAAKAAAEAKAAADATATAEAEAAAAADIAAPILISPKAGDELISGEELVFAGTGEPGTEVEIVIDGQVVGVTQVGDDGTWSFTTTVDEPGEYEVSLNALDADGQVAASSEPVTLSFAAPAEQMACAEEYVVVVDDWLSKLSDKYWEDMFLYPAIVEVTNQRYAVDNTFANISNPDLIEPGWKLCIVDAATAEEITRSHE